MVGHRSPTPYFRPIVAISFTIEHNIAGDSEIFSHLTRFLLHCISCILIFLFFRRYLSKTTSSFLDPLLFAIHPINTYTVTWIPGWNDSIILIDFIVCFIACFIEYIDKKKLYILAKHTVFIFFVFVQKKIRINFNTNIYFLLHYFIRI